MPDPIAIVKGDGACLVDEQHNRYIDAISSWWVNLHGHANPYIAQKVYEQALTLEQVIFAGFTHEPAVQLAERLLPLLPANFDRIFYSDNGSTSTEVALKMTIQYWWNKGDHTRNKILAFNNAYHGDTFGAMSVSERSVFTLAFHNKLFEVIFIDVPEKDFDPLSLSIPWQEIACFIYEPMVQGAGGMVMYDSDGLNSLLVHCRENKILCIADEVMTGFGRTGKLFASSFCETKPDIICLSKGLTGGTMALGITAAVQKVYDAFVSDDKLHTFFHGHSFTANPLACSAALASLDLLEKKETAIAIESIVRQNGRFLDDLKTRHFPTAVKNPRQAGTIVAFELDKGKDEYLNQVGTLFTQKALGRHIYIRPLGNTVYIMPPYCISTVQLEQVHEAVLAILEEL